MRTKYQIGKLKNVRKEMERTEIKILGMSKVRWTGAGRTDSDQHTIIHTGENKPEKGEKQVK